MCDHLHCTPGVCFVVPPHILKHIAENHKDRTVRRRALHNLYIQGQLRGMREGIGQFAFSGLGTGTKRRTVYDAKHGQQLPGQLVCSEGAKSFADEDVKNAYTYSGNTYDFYDKVFGRNSIDGRGMRLDSTVHYAEQFDNAFWNGQQMVYGDGDGVLFGDFTQCIDVVGHELTHGITQFTAGLQYQGQSGALNESMSDVFGTLIKQYTNKQDVNAADWLIGKGLFIPEAGVNRTALRSMKAPGTAYDDPNGIGKDPQPADMGGYVTGPEDNGGVHINSGIPNHAFFLAAMAIGGNAWEVTGRIWYEALTTRLHPQAQFADAKAATIEVAAKYGTKAVNAVTQAWAEVKVK